MQHFQSCCKDSFTSSCRSSLVRPSLQCKLYAKHNNTSGAYIYGENWFTLASLPIPLSSYFVKDIIYDRPDSSGFRGGMKRSLTVLDLLRSSMASRPVLNHDILLEVTAAACWDYAAALLDTCRFIHYEGHKALLRQTVYLDSPATLLDFLAFLRYGLDDARHSSVRDLYLALERSRMMKKASPQLLLSLPLMHNLASLSISESEFVFDDDFGLCGAFAALTSLRELHLPAAGERTVQFLQTSQSTFVTVNISFPPEYDEDGFFDECITPMDAWPQYHPAVLLANSRLTLRDLECERWYTHPEIMPDPGLVYSEMRRLRMASASMPLTLPFIRAYPNLTYLSIHTGESDDGHCYASDVQRYTDHRRKNMLAQAPPGCSWAELGEYSGSLVDFYLLGLVCPIGRVELRALHRNHRYMLGPALSCARPRRLVLHGWPGLLESPPDVFAALQGEAGSRLEHLSLDARLDGKDRDADVSIILVRLSYVWDLRT